MDLPTVATESSTPGYPPRYIVESLIRIKGPQTTQYYVAEHLAGLIAGREPAQRFDGYTSCPLLVREGSALLVEFDYDGKLTPTIPLVDPLQESWAAWVMKTRMLKPAYLAALHGRV